MKTDHFAEFRQPPIEDGGYVGYRVTQPERRRELNDYSSADAVTRQPFFRKAAGCYPRGGQGLNKLGISFRSAALPTGSLCLASLSLPFSLTSPAWMLCAPLLPPCLDRFPTYS